jgi:hypothetical protein
VVEGDGLENRFTLWVTGVRIPPAPVEGFFWRNLNLGAEKNLNVRVHDKDS